MWHRPLLHVSYLPIQVLKTSLVNGLEKRVKALENIYAEFQCPTEKNGYRLIENQCYFFDRINRDYKIAQEKCKTVFGSNFIGKMWEPQSLHINNVVSSEAKSIFGTSVDHRFWIGITNDGNFRYQSTGVPAEWRMPYYSDTEKNGYIGTTHCLHYYLMDSTWRTSDFCTGSTFQHFTVCEIDREKILSDDRTAASRSLIVTIE